MEKEEHPWSVPATLDQIPETGLHMEIAAPDSVLPAVARMAGVRSVAKLTAIFDLSRRGAGIQVDGHVSGRVGQTCVISLEPMESAVEEDIDLRFEPMAADAPEVSAEHSADPDEEPPEPLIGGKIDLGAIAIEFLMLGLDPYPRKPGAQFAPPKVEEAAAHPFAALAALKKGPGEGNP